MVETHIYYFIHSYGLKLCDWNMFYKIGNVDVLVSSLWYLNQVNEILKDKNDLSLCDLGIIVYLYNWLCW